MHWHAYRRQLLGLTYLLVLALLVAFSIGVYDKALPWQRTVPVTIQTRMPGLELNPQSDVKFQGVLVGSVRSVTTDGRIATVHLALDRHYVHEIPADVDAMIVPKTLFGEKFVDLQSATGPITASSTGSAATPIAGGDVIHQSSTSVELGALFDKLVPILHALHPQELAQLLNNLAQALDGRGEEIASTLNESRAFLTRLDPSLPGLVDDITLLGHTSDVYDRSARDLLQLLDDSATISHQGLVPDEARLARFLDSLVTTSDTTTQVLRANGQAIVHLNGRARPVLALLAHYSSEVPCVLRTLNIGNNLANQATAARGSLIGLSIDMIVQHTPYKNGVDNPGNPHNDAYPTNLPDQIPSFAPHCPVLPARLDHIPPTKPYSLEPYGQADPPAGSGDPTTAAGAAQTLRDHRDALARALASRDLHVAPGRVPGYASLLLAPLLSEGSVTVR